MTILKPATATWSARMGALVVAAAATVVLTPEAGVAAPIIQVPTPATGSAGSWITIQTTATDVFRDAGGVLKVANTGGVIDNNAVQFSTAACATAATTMPAGARTVPAVTLNGTTTVTSSAQFDTTADVGKGIAAAGIPANATLTAVGTTSSATLSTAATAGGGGNPVTVPAAISASGTTNFATTGPYWAQQAVAVSGNKLVVRAPAYLPAAPTGTTYNICVYNNVAGPNTLVLTTSAFKAYTAPTITSVSTTSGPSIGGNTIVISGGGFSTTTRATIGGVPLETPTVVTTSTPQTITGKVPASALDTAPIVVTAEGGSVTHTTEYDYQDGVSVTPSTATQTATTILDIFGAGFKAADLNFASLPTLTTLGAPTIVAGTGVFTLAAHGLEVGDRVRLGTVTGGTGWASNTAYFVRSVPTVNTFTLSTSPRGAVLTGTGTPTLDAIYDLTLLGAPAGTTLGTVTLTNAGEEVTVSAPHGLVVGSAVRLGAVTTTTTVTAGTVYYVASVVDDDTVTLQTGTGAPVLIDADGTAAAIYAQDTDTHVVLSLGSFDPMAAPGTRGAPLAECTGVTVLRDTELICTLAGASWRLPEGSYQVTVVDNLRGDPTATLNRNAPQRATIVTSGSTFTVAPY